MTNTIAGSIHPLAVGTSEELTELLCSLSDFDVTRVANHAVELEAAIGFHFGQRCVRITNTAGTITRLGDGKGNTLGRIVHEFGRDILQAPCLVQGALFGEMYDGFQVVAEVEYEVVV